MVLLPCNTSADTGERLTSEELTDACIGSFLVGGCMPGEDRAEAGEEGRAGGVTEDEDEDEGEEVDVGLEVVVEEEQKEEEEKQKDEKVVEDEGEEEEEDVGQGHRDSGAAPTSLSSTAPPPIPDSVIAKVWFLSLVHFCPTTIRLDVSWRNINPPGNA